MIGGTGVVGGSDGKERKSDGGAYALKSKFGTSQRYSRY